MYCRRTSCTLYYQFAPVPYCWVPPSSLRTLTTARSPDCDPPQPLYCESLLLSLPLFFSKTSLLEVPAFYCTSPHCAPPPPMPLGCRSPSRVGCPHFDETLGTGVPIFCDPAPYATHSRRVGLLYLWNPRYTACSYLRSTAHIHIRPLTLGNMLFLLATSNIYRVHRTFVIRAPHVAFMSQSYFRYFYCLR